MTNFNTNFSLIWSAIVTILMTLVACSDKQVSNDEWRMQFYPAVGQTAATLSTYSQKTGAYENYYVNEGKWTLNGAIPSPEVTIAKGNLRMDFIPGIGSAPGLSVYCTKTGEYQQFYLQEGRWNVNPNIPQPNITVKKGDIRMEFVPASGGDVAAMNVYSTITKEYERLYLDGKEWKRNPYFPETNKI